MLPKQHHAAQTGWPHKKDTVASTITSWALLALLAMGHLKQLWGHPRLTFPSPLDLQPPKYQEAPGKTWMSNYIHYTLGVLCYFPGERATKGKEPYCTKRDGGRDDVTITKDGWQVSENTWFWNAQKVPSVLSVGAGHYLTELQSWDSR